MSNLITLHNQSSKWEIDPFGAKTKKLILDGQKVGVYNSQNGRGTHPCGPNAGEVKNGSYIIDDQTYFLDRHGFLRKVSWVEEPIKAAIKDSNLRLSYTNAKERPNEEILRCYPRYFRYEADFALFPNSLFHQLSFTNLTQDKNAPTDLCSHLYLLWMPGMRIAGLQGLIFRNESIPGSITFEVLQNPVFQERTVRDWHFTLPEGLREFDIEYPNGMIINLSFRKPCSTRADYTNPGIKNVIVWTDPSQGDFLCFEPTMIGKGALNDGTAFNTALNQTVYIAYDLTLKRKP